MAGLSCHLCSLMHRSGFCFPSTASGPKGISDDPGTSRLQGYQNDGSAENVMSVRAISPVMVAGTGMGLPCLFAPCPPFHCSYQWGLPAFAQIVVTYVPGVKPGVRQAAHDKIRVLLHLARCICPYGCTGLS